MPAACLWGRNVGSPSDGSCILTEALNLQGKGLQEEVSRLQTIRVYKQETNRVFTDTLERGVLELHKTKDEKLKTTLEQELNGDFHDREGLKFVTSGRRRKVSFLACRSAIPGHV